MQVKIEKFDDLGQGLARIDNKVCFIEKSIPDEVVDIDITLNKKDYSKGKIKNIILESKDRIEPICKYYHECGGCQFLHLNDSKEKEFKIEKAKNYLGQCDNFFETLDFNYRDKVTLHVKDGLIGYYDTKSHDLVQINYCYLLNKKINLVIELLNNNLDSNFNGEIIIRENSNEETMLVIKGNYQYVDKLLDNNLIDNLIYNDKVLKGKDYFIENILDYKFKVHYNSFFQVNRLGLEKIIKILDKTLKDKKLNKVLDLYSGTSVLGIILSKYAENVISIEENTFATNDAKYNLELNKINNLEVINSKVEDYITSFKNIDLVLVDPARSGLDKKTLNNLVKLKSPYLIYISCEMISLKRDLEVLKDVYNLKKVYLVDMFPKTNKVETIAFLEVLK